jgi:hypothetical protein
MHPGQVILLSFFGAFFAGYWYLRLRSLTLGNSWRWTKKLRKLENLIVGRAQSRPRRFIQENAPACHSRYTDVVVFPSSWNHFDSGVHWLYWVPVLAAFFFAALAYTYGWSTPYADVVFGALALAYLIPVVYFGSKAVRMLRQSGLFFRLALVQLSCFLAQADAQRKRMVELLATAKIILKSREFWNSSPYLSAEMEEIRRAARETWYACDGYCNNCKRRASCRPVVAEEPFLPPQLGARCVTCGAVAVIPRRIIGVIGPCPAYELRDDILYVRLRHDTEDVGLDGAVDGVEVRPGGSFSYDMAVAVVYQRLENAGFLTPRTRAIGEELPPDTPYRWGDLPIYCDDVSVFSTNTIRMMQKVGAGTQ